MRLWVVVPAYNEAAGITATLTALAAQRRAPEGVLVVDNASTDGTGDVVRAFAAAHPGFELVTEPEKGTGSAADTGFRAAIERGATHIARTDADCLPPPDWTAAIVGGFESGLEMVAGGIRARTDEFRLTVGERLLPIGQAIAASFGRLRPSNRGPQFKGPYVMAPACSLAITADLYERSGGFPRAPIEEIHDDRELVNRVRRLTSAYGRRRDVWVYWSMRRTRAYGLVGTLRWYRDHGNNPQVIDIRLAHPAKPEHHEPEHHEPERREPERREAQQNEVRQGAARRAMAWERRLYLTAHPFVYPLLRGLARIGPVVRVPGVGAAVNDAGLARAVLMDGETFRKDGPGSSGELWTSVLGPSLLINMEGEAHRVLRRRLSELFTPGYTTRLVEEVLTEPLERLTGRLRRGETVDLVEATQMMAGAVICRLVGIPIEGDAAERERTYLRYYRQASEIITMVKLTTRTFSPRQQAMAHAVLDPIADIAAKAYAEGDPATVLGRMRAAGMSEQEARGITGAFFITGTETVATALPRLIALLHDSGRLTTLAERIQSGDKAALDAAIDEALRVATPTPMMLRSVAKPGRIGPVTVRPGHRILIVTHNCAIAHGDFDPDRPHSPDVRRLFFGAGPHFCIGYPLAMAELRAITTALLTTTPLTITTRRAARHVLLPAYASLEVRRAQ